MSQFEIIISPTKVLYIWLKFRVSPYSWWILTWDTFNIRQFDNLAFQWALITILIFHCEMSYNIAIITYKKSQTSLCAKRGLRWPK